MRACIHRGAHEIGGSCVEVEADGYRLVLDVGRPLAAARGEVVPLPAIPGLESGDPSLLGVIITHAHQDHWGLAEQIPPSIPIYMGEATHRILVEAAFWTSGLTVQPAGFLVHRQPFELGPFRVTPYLNDHSAFDAYSLLVEAGDARLFYTGDVRGHGRKSALFQELLRKPPTDVDVLLMEGTNIRPDEAVSEPAVTESELEHSMTTLMRDTPGMVLAVSSAQNIDRLVTIYRAAKRSGRTTVMDLYGASIAKATGNPNIPQPGPGWPDVRVFVPQWQRVKVKKAEQFYRVDDVRDQRVYEQYFTEHCGKAVLMFSTASGPALARAGCLDGAAAVWSLWPGYLKEKSGKALMDFLDAHHIPMSQLHTSGHASPADLRRLTEAVNAKRIVPIHSFAGHRFSDLFKSVTVEPDGTWWDV